MDILFIVFALFLLFAGFQDVKTRKVSDKLTACMWVLGALLCTINVNLYPFIVGVFAILYLYNSFAYPINPYFGFGWADVLIIPIYCTFLYSIGGRIALMLGIGMATMLTVAYLRLFKKGAPYVMFLAVSYVFALIVMRFVVVPVF